jgi:hypothetical protein
VAAHGDAIAGAPARLDAANLSDVTMPPIAPVIETNWAPPDVDDEYGPVQFQKAKTAMWLPKSADWYCNFMGQRYHRRHSFSRSLLFSVDDTQKIGAPKESQQQE